MAAVKVNAYAPAVPAAGVPLSVPVPSPLSTNVTPVGSAAPVRVIAATGDAVVDTVNVPATSTVKLVVLALANVGALFTINVKACGAVAPAVFVAVKAIANVPPVPAAGVPLNVPVPLPLSTNVTPAGSATPLRVSAAAGKPLVVTVNDPAAPTANVVLGALVIVGA